MPFATFDHTPGPRLEFRRESSRGSRPTLRARSPRRTPAPCRPSRTRTPCARTASRRRRRRRSASGRSRRATRALPSCTTSTRRASRPSTRTPGCRAACSGVPPRLRTADDDGGGRVILRREDVARHPAHVGAERVERLDQHRGLNRHVQRAHDARAGERLLARRSARASAIRPGISCSARRISLRPHSARPRSATLYGCRPALRARS